MYEANICQQKGKTDTYFELVVDVNKTYIPQLCLCVYHNVLAV